MEYAFYMIEENLIVVIPEHALVFSEFDANEFLYINLGAL